MLILGAILVASPTEWVLCQHMDGRFANRIGVSLTVKKNGCCKDLNNFSNVLLGNFRKENSFGKA
jgi:hypothetical protein